jgi:sulfatase modifying factor 1
MILRRLAAVCWGALAGASGGEPSAATLPGPNGHRLVVVAAGTYEVGFPGAPFHPVREVRLKAFRIADTETTNAQFAAFVKATGHVTDAEKSGLAKTFREGMADWVWKPDNEASWRFPFGKDGPAAADLPDHPVTQISGRDARAYAKWIGGRLPTLDEWEVAARAGATTLYPWGGVFDPAKANIWNGKSHRRNTREDGFVYTSPVRTYPPNAWGLHDVIGNVFEYCEGLPPNLAFTGKERPAVVAGRGGSWWCSEGTCSFFNCRDIGTMAEGVSLPNQGFRLVMDPP